MKSKFLVTKLFLLLVPCFLGISSPPAFAQDKATPALTTDQLLHPPGKKLDISLEEALEMTLRDNLGLKVDAGNIPIARTSIMSASGLFWPTYYLTPQYSNTKTPERNALQTKYKTSAYGFKTGFMWKVISGTSMDLSYNHNYSSVDTSSSFFANPNPWSASLSLTLTQPLLKGAWKQVNRTDITRAELGVDMATAQHEDLRQQALLSVNQAYWELVYAREAYVVLKVSLQVAKDQLEITDQRIQAKLGAPVERVANLADIARREQNLIMGEQQVLKAEDDLKALIFPFQDDQEWEMRLVPTSPYDRELDFAIPNAAEAATRAMKNRRDLQATQLAVADAKVTLQRAESNLLPQLDFFGSYSNQNVHNKAHMLWDEIWDSTYPGFTLGLEFSLPLGNVTAQGDYKRAELMLEQAERQHRLAQVGIWQEVRAAVRNLVSLHKDIEAGRVSVRLAKTNLNTEEEKFKVGKTIAFEVQRRNEDLADAYTRLIRSIVDFRISIASLHRATGVLGRATLTESNRDKSEKQPEK